MATGRISVTPEGLSWHVDNLGVDNMVIRTSKGDIHIGDQFVSHAWDDNVITITRFEWDGAQDEWLCWASGWGRDRDMYARLDSLMDPEGFTRVGAPTTLPEIEAYLNG